ncbi:MAG: type I glyceraldehyde-3-phosphate dehydrogenase [bacterium]
MATKIGINGFGRIGRLVARAALEQTDGAVEIVAVNDLTDAKTLAHLFKYDSVHRTWPEAVKAEGDSIHVGSRSFKVLSEKDPAQLPWGKLGVQVVIESTGRFTDKATAGKHIEAGAKKVIISAPGKEVDATFVLGVNEKTYDPANHHVVSNASCTTNCLGPVVHVLMKFDVQCGLMTTIHSYTNDQPVLDFVHKDLRRARAAALSMIPTKTGAAAAIGLVIPEMKGKLDGFAIRVPTPNVSVVDLSLNVGKEVTAEEINAAVKAASEGELKGILGYSEDPLVSSDFNHCPLSSIFDPAYTRVIGGKLVKVLSWYDNEWGYSNRCIDLVKIMV